MEILKIYKPANLSVLAYANGFTLWHYKTQDTLDVVFGEDYFKDSWDMLRSGDMIMVSSETKDSDGNVFTHAGVGITESVIQQKVVVKSLTLPAVLS